MERRGWAEHVSIPLSPPLPPFLFRIYSGAYLFRIQHGTEVHSMSEGRPVATQVIRGPVLTEVRQAKKIMKQGGGH